MSTVARPAFEADFAMSLGEDWPALYERNNHALDNEWSWTGWKTRKWPANVIRPGLLVYGFDLREESRQLFVLRRVVKGGTFSFRSMDEFVRKVKEITGRTPDADEDDDSAKKWPEVEDRVESLERGACTGICATWEVLPKIVAIPLEGKCPRLGWIDLRKPFFGME